MRKRDLWIIFGAVIAAVILGITQLWGIAEETAAWGLSFQTEGKSPIAPADAAHLRKLDAAYLGSTQEKVLYLTFDAGYENGCTEQILDTLKKHDVKAAFFLMKLFLELSM